jgi:hypothetical protein
MAGGSGGPVIQKQTGSVVGVLLTADDAKQARVVGFQTLCLGVSASQPAATPPPDAATERLLRVFPSLYWYASDAYLRETTRHGFGQPQNHDAFVKSTKAMFEGSKEVQSREGQQYEVRLRLFDPESPEECWILELARQGNVWTPKSGYKYFEGKPTFDLFEDEIFAGIRIMGSMKPYFERALAAYSEGKDFRVAFTKRPATAQAAPAIGSALQLVGRWRSTNATLNAATDITFRKDGTFVGSVEASRRITGSFSGKWTLTNGTLNYEYTAASGVRIPIGTKDQDKLITLTKDHYTIVNAIGLNETYVRVQ